MLLIAGLRHVLRFTGRRDRLSFHRTIGLLATKQVSRLSCTIYTLYGPDRLAEYCHHQLRGSTFSTLRT